MMMPATPKKWAYPPIRFECPRLADEEETDRLREHAYKLLGKRIMENWSQYDVHV